MMTQKQWLFSNLDLSHLQMAMTTEIDLHRNSARPVPHHLKNLEELAAKLAAIREGTGREYDDEEDMVGTPCEQLLVTLIPKDYERWEEPYTVIPVGAKWAAAHKESLERPVGEKLYTQRTHAYRACRRLNTAFWENKAEAN